jgi:WD40 repeat protein
VNFASTAAWSPINDQLAVLERNFPDSNCQSKPTFRIIDTNTQTELFQKANRNISDFKWISQGDSIIFVSTANQLSLINSRTNQTLYTLPLPADLNRLAWIPDKNLLLVTTFKYENAKQYTYAFHILDISTGEALFSLPDIQSFSLAADQTHIALINASGDMEIGAITRIGNKITYQISHKFAAPNTRFFDVWWNPQTTGIATLSSVSPVPDGIQNAVLQIWDLDQLDTSQTISSVLVASEGSIEDFAWHPDGKTFAVSFIGGLIKIWSLI